MQSTQAIEILHDFQFSSGRIFEAKFNDVDRIHKSDRCQWYLIIYGKRYDLRFVKMEGEKRYFEGISLDRSGEFPNAPTLKEDELDHYILLDIKNMILTLRETDIIDEWSISKL
jgi:hypothetical protein